MNLLTTTTTTLVDVIFCPFLLFVIELLSDKGRCKIILYFSHTFFERIFASLSRTYSLFLTLHTLTKTLTNTHTHTHTHTHTQTNTHTHTQTHTYTQTHTHTHTLTNTHTQTHIHTHTPHSCLSPLLHSIQTCITQQRVSPACSQKIVEIRPKICNKI